MNKTLIRYSEAFKLKVVNELETGKLTSFGEAKERYGIRSWSTISDWLRKYGKNHLLNKVVVVQKADEKSEIKKYKDRVKKLEKALANAHLDLVIEKEYFQMLCESTDTEADKFKKKVKLH